MKKMILALLSVAIFTLTSCNDWFDVTSGSEIREEDHYKTVTGFQQSLIGCYIAMTDDALYGKNLSWYLTELLANQFQPVALYNTTSVDYRMQNYNYQHADAVPVIDGIWAKAYNVIANADEALKYIDKNASVLDDINYHIIKGELLAIRAYTHFDLLRLYGYGNWANRSAELNAKYTIPYVAALSKDATAQLTGKETIELILADLEEAAGLLKDYDPITGKHDASFYAQVNDDGFYKDRTLHLNYYAVKALQARVLLWEGSSENKTKALAAAEEVITGVEGGIRQDGMYTYLYFITPNTINNSNTSMASENLFGLNVSTLSSKITKYINPYYVDTDYAAMFLGSNDAINLYEGSSSDIRFSMMLNQSTNNSTMGYVPLKIYQGNLNNFFKNKVSMIRLPEIYYIAAECYATGPNPNLALAMDRLNTIRQNRGVYNNLEELTATEIVGEIEKEYRKEFLSEGVVFYYYKRTGATTVPHYSEQMGDMQYVLPYPEFELQSGRVQ